MRDANKDAVIIHSAHCEGQTVQELIVAKASGMAAGRLSDSPPFRGRLRSHHCFSAPEGVVVFGCWTKLHCQTIKTFITTTTTTTNHQTLTPTFTIHIPIYLKL